MLAIIGTLRRAETPATHFRLARSGTGRTADHASIPTGLPSGDRDLRSGTGTRQLRERRRGDCYAISDIEAGHTLSSGAPGGVPVVYGLAPDGVRSVTFYYNGRYPGHPLTVLAINNVFILHDLRDRSRTTLPQQARLACRQRPRDQDDHTVLARDRGDSRDSSCRATSRGVSSALSPTGQPTAGLPLSVWAEPKGKSAPTADPALTRLGLREGGGVPRR